MGVLLCVFFIAFWMALEPGLNNSEILNFTTCCRRSLFIFLSAVPRAELRLSQAGVMVRRRASRSDLEGRGGSESWSAPAELFLRMACVRRMERWSALMVWGVRRWGEREMV